MDSSDNAGSSRPKRLCTNIDLRSTQNEIERLLFESDDENIDYADSGSDYLNESDSDSSTTSDLGGKGHAANVVLHRISEKLNNGHSIYMDNFYNSIDLAEQLLQKKTYCTGTLRSNRKRNPEAEVKSKLKPGETKAMYSNGVLVGKWKDKRDVMYISTEFKNNLILAKNKKGQEKLKPEPIANYNTFMSAIDRQDQMNSYYPCLRKTIR